MRRWPIDSAGLEIVILTGSGISAESGISTFRDKDGIWAQHDWRDVATLEGYQRNPGAVLDFYNMRRRLHAGIVPNAAHAALAKLEQAHAGAVLLVTQNVDELHERAGSRNLTHMHGEIFKALCMGCRHRQEWREPLTLGTACPACGDAGHLRPDVVWFGETPYALADIALALDRCHLFLSIGTSGTVYPAAGFAARARAAGAVTIELNLEPSDGARHFDDAVYGPATEVVPAFVDDLLSGALLHRLQS